MANNDIPVVSQDDADMLELREAMESAEDHKYAVRFHKKYILTEHEKLWLASHDLDIYDIITGHIPGAGAVYQTVDTLKFYWNSRLKNAGSSFRWDTYYSPTGPTYNTGLQVMGGAIGNIPRNMYPPGNETVYREGSTVRIAARIRTMREIEPFLEGGEDRYGRRQGDVE